MITIELTEKRRLRKLHDRQKLIDTVDDLGDTLMVFFQTLP